MLTTEQARAIAAARTQLGPMANQLSSGEILAVIARSNGDLTALTGQALDTIAKQPKLSDVTPKQNS